MDTRNRSIQGRLGIATLPGVVRDLWRARATGILHLSEGSTAKQIVFKNGDIVFAATNVKQERLGERLVRAGRIKRTILDLAVRVMERSHQRLGKTIVEWGWVSPEEMKRWIAEQIKSIIYSVFTWTSGEYRFEPVEQPVDPDLVLELQTAEVIWEGVRRIGNMRAIRAGVGDSGGVLELAGGQRLGIPIGQTEGFILARVDGRSTISEIVSGCPLEEEEALRSVYALLLAGVLERAESRPPVASPGVSETGPGSVRDTREPKARRSEAGDEENRFRDGVVARYAAMQFGNLYDRLGVDILAQTEEIRDAYQDVVRSLDPQPQYRDRIRDLEPRLQKVKRKVDEAYQVLTDPERRRAYDKSIDVASPESTLSTEAKPQRGMEEADKTLSAQTLAASPSAVPDSTSDSRSGDADRKRKAELRYAEAQSHLDAGDYFDAIAALDDALRLDPGKGEYHRFLAQLLAENPSCAEASQEHFERAIELDPRDTEAYLGLAALLERDGLTEQARRVREKLMSLDWQDRLVPEAQPAPKNS